MKLHHSALIVTFPFPESTTLRHNLPNPHLKFESNLRPSAVFESDMEITSFYLDLYC